MYQWRKFEFFEDKYGGKSEIPEEIKGKINCSSGGRGKVAVGCDDGTVSLLDQGLKFNYDFPAHSSSVLFLQQPKLSKCTACTFTLDLPAVHFMCMHSFHQRCLGDSEKECPECAPEYRSVLEMKWNREQNSKDQTQVFQKVKNSKDGFSVIAEYFGKGIVSKTKPVENAAPGVTV